MCLPSKKQRHAGFLVPHGCTPIGPVITIFANEHFVVADKPAGALTVPGRTGASDPRPCIGRELETALGIRLWPIHRLDCEVSGLVVFAKNADAHRAANTWFAGREVRKIYQALTARGEGVTPSSQPMEWRCRLLRGKKRAYESPHGKEAVTRAVCLGERAAGLGWRLEPLTGRSHQLRVQLAAHGFPIVGDVLYGSSIPYALPGIALRAVELDLHACGDREKWAVPAELRVEGLFD